MDAREGSRRTHRTHDHTYGHGGRSPCGSSSTGASPAEHDPSEVPREWKFLGRVTRVGWKFLGRYWSYWSFNEHSTSATPVTRVSKSTFQKLKLTAQKPQRRRRRGRHHTAYQCPFFRKIFHDADLAMAQYLAHIGIPYWWNPKSQRDIPAFITWPENLPNDRVILGMKLFRSEPLKHGPPSHKASVTNFVFRTLLAPQPTQNPQQEPSNADPTETPLNPSALVPVDTVLSLRKIFRDQLDPLALHTALLGKVFNEERITLASASYVRILPRHLALWIISKLHLEGQACTDPLALIPDPVPPGSKWYLPSFLPSTLGKDLRTQESFIKDFPSFLDDPSNPTWSKTPFHHNVLIAIDDKDEHFIHLLIDKCRVSAAAGITVDLVLGSPHGSSSLSSYKMKNPSAYFHYFLKIPHQSLPFGSPLGWYSLPNQSLSYDSTKKCFSQSHFSHPDFPPRDKFPTSPYPTHFLLFNKKTGETLYNLSHQDIKDLAWSTLGSLAPLPPNQYPVIIRPTRPPTTKNPRPPDSSFPIQYTYMGQNSTEKNPLLHPIAPLLCAIWYHRDHIIPHGVMAFVWELTKSSHQFTPDGATPTILARSSAQPAGAGVGGRQPPLAATSSQFWSTVYYSRHTSYMALERHARTNLKHSHTLASNKMPPARLLWLL